MPKDKALLEVVVQVLCGKAKTESMLKEGGKGQKKSPCTEQTVVHFHCES